MSAGGNFLGKPGKEEIGVREPQVCGQAQRALTVGGATMPAAREGEEAEGPHSVALRAWVGRSGQACAQ